MNFDDTPQEAEFRAEARSWLEANGKPKTSEEQEAVSLEGVSLDDVRRAQEWQAKKADARWACITWPREYGGRGASPIENVIWNQEEAKYETHADIFGIDQGMLGPTIMTHGTEEQKADYLPPLLRGDKIWCQLFSEPGSGSDLAGLRTTAVRDGDDWILNGQKIWTTWAHFADIGMIVTRTDPTAPKHAGITYFLIDMKSPGVEPRPIKQISGSSGFNQVFFTDVRVPDSNRVGAINDGWRGAITTLMNERAAVGGGGAGLFHKLMELARQCSWGDGSALDDTAVRQRLADFYVRGQGLRYTGYRTLTALSRGQTPGPENSISKLIGASLGQEMAALACELQGCAGALNDQTGSPAGGFFQEQWLSAPGMRIAGGTDEIMRNIIAERVLKLPGEIRADKGVAFQDIPTGV